MRLSSLCRPTALATAVLAAASFALPVSARAQATGGVQGTVTNAEHGTLLAGVVVRVGTTQITTTTGPNGKFTLQRIPTGAQTIVFRWLGFAPKEVPVQITGGGMVTVDAKLEPMPVTLSEIMVSGASRSPERVTQAPSAISTVDPRVLSTTSLNGQAPLALRQVPGVDLAQSGMTDFNVNARGFNSSLNRRVLVLQDGRDLSIAFLGAQEWNTLTLPTEDFTKMEFVSGPGSALYGANAYSGVLDITTPTAREVVGTKVTVGGGMLGGPAAGWESGSPASYRADLRHAGVLSDGRFGYRLNFGYSGTDTWSRSRTTFDSLSVRNEYADATDSLVPKYGAERRALLGQTINTSTGAPEGDRDPITTMYGSARFDYYLSDGSVLTAEGGAAKVENEVFVTGIGRVQVTGASRPWGRINWAAPGFNVMAYWNGRRAGSCEKWATPGSDIGTPQYSLASGAPLCETANVFHIEAQGNEAWSNDKGQFVYGASIRNTRLNTDSTLMIGNVDDRSDYSYAAFAQFSWRFSDVVRLVAAGRWDAGSLIDPQFSPKVGLVVSPSPNHSIRLTYNKAFQTPNYSEYFLRATAGRIPMALVEGGLRAAVAPAPDTLTLKKALAKVTPNTLFDQQAPLSDGVYRPVVARGNNKLQVEKNTGYEIGYRGDVTKRLTVTADVYANHLTNFVTDLIVGINPAYGRWTAPTNTTSALTATEKAVLEGAVYQAMNGNPALRPYTPGLTRQEDKLTAIVLSYSNAGEAWQWGTDVSANYAVSSEINVNATYSYFKYDVNEETVATGDKLLANTPKWRYNIAANYAGHSGFEAGLNWRSSAGFSWAAGVFAGWIEPGATLDANLGYKLTNNFKVFLNGTNLANRQWFSIYGGSVTGRRVMGGVTATF